MRPGPSSRRRPRSSRDAEPRLLRAAFGALAMLAVATPALAQPLFSDDPAVVAPGHLELFSAVAASERGPNTNVNVSALDVAAGVLPTLELDLTIGYSKVETSSAQDPEDDGAPVTFGFKWEPVSTRHFALGIVPNASFDATGGDDWSISYPLLVELRSGRFRAGANGAWVQQPGERDGWQATTYAAVAAGEASELLGEVYTQAFDERGDPEVGFQLGFDWAIQGPLHLIASGGTGIYGGSGTRRDWTVFAGLQLLLGPWDDAPEAPADPVARAPGSLAQGLPLELTDRQLSRQR